MTRLPMLEEIWFVAFFALLSLTVVLPLASLYCLRTAPRHPTLLGRIRGKLRAELLSSAGYLAMGHVALPHALDGVGTAVFAAVVLIPVGVLGLLCHLRHYMRWRALLARRPECKPLQPGWIVAARRWLYRYRWRI